MRIITLFVLSFVLLSCGNQNKKAGDVENQASSTYVVKYAKGFDVKKHANYTQVTVRDPWDSTTVLQKYVLVDKSKPLPENLPQGTFVRTPLTSIAAYSTIHCTVLKELRSLEIIKAVCESEHIKVEYIIDGVKNGTILDLGLASKPDVEKLMMLDPEAVFVCPIQGVSYGHIEKTKIPVIESPDYMEDSPLGRAEWLRFYSLFIGKEELADSLFQEVEKQYIEVSERVKSVSHKPTVFADLKYGSSWYVAGGKSFISNLFKDAGATYVWANDPATGAMPLAFETVLDKAGGAEFWLIKYNNLLDKSDMTYQKLEKELKMYTYFDAFKNRKIYECNTGKATYYEDLPIHPEWILQDIAYVFHPDLFPAYVPKYYKKMKE